MLLGNPGKRRINRFELGVEPILELPKAPVRLQPEGRRFWNDLAPELCRLGVLTKLDLKFFELLCECWSDYREYCDFIEKHGTFFTVTRPVRQPDGTIAKEVCNVREFPQVAQRGHAAAAVVRMLSQFGLSAKMRSRFFPRLVAENPGGRWLLE
jgi:P27 family predicted phage terminase small subunit